MIESFYHVEKLQVRSALPRRIRFPSPDETKLSAIQQRQHSSMQPPVRKSSPAIGRRIELMEKINTNRRGRQGHTRPDAEPKLLVARPNGWGDC
jgi:hypothetical protein